MKTGHISACFLDYFVMINTRMSGLCSASVTCSFSATLLHNSSTNIVCSVKVQQSEYQKLPCVRSYLPLLSLKKSVGTGLLVLQKYFARVSSIQWGKLPPPPPPPPPPPHPPPPTPLPQRFCECLNSPNAPTFL